MTPKIYLSGPIRGLPYHGATQWRDAVTAELKAAGMISLCPMRAKSVLDNGKILDAEEGWQEELVDEHIYLAPKAIVTRDRNDVHLCDALLVNLLGATQVSIGTVFEIAWAYEHTKPVFLAMEKRGNPHEHIFVRETCGFQGESLEQVLAVLKSTYAPYVE